MDALFLFLKDPPAVLPAHGLFLHFRVGGKGIYVFHLMVEFVITHVFLLIRCITI